MEKKNLGPWFRIQTLTVKDDKINWVKTIYDAWKDADLLESAAASQLVGRHLCH